MKLHLIDSSNNRNEYYELDNDKYSYVWQEIQNITDKYNYSVMHFMTPQIKENTIIIHWAELFGTLSEPYIEIIDPPDKIICAFELNIARIKKYSGR